MGECYSEWMFQCRNLESTSNARQTLSTRSIYTDDMYRMYRNTFYTQWTPLIRFMYIMKPLCSAAYRTQILLEDHSTNLTKIHNIFLVKFRNQLFFKNICIEVASTCTSCLSVFFKTINRYRIVFLSSLPLFCFPVFS